MGVTSFDTVDGYGFVDISGATQVVGPIRCARKVLQRTTVDLARHVTYALAVHGLEAAGGAAALNFDRANGADSPIEAFLTELDSWGDAIGFRAHGGLGLSDDELGSIVRRPANVSAEELVVASAVACSSSLDGGVVIASTESEDGLRTALESAGAASITVVPDLGEALRTEAEVTFVRGATGVLDHEALAEVKPTRIIGLQPLTTTARGLAVATRRDAVVVPDFVSAAGPYLGAVEVEDIATATKLVSDRLDGEGTRSFVAACEIAEAQLRTWTDDLPFGRPLAP